MTCIEFAYSIVASVIAVIVVALFLKIRIYLLIKSMIGHYTEELHPQKYTLKYSFWQNLLKINHTFILDKEQLYTFGHPKHEWGWSGEYKIDLINPYFAKGVFKLKYGENYIDKQLWGFHEIIINTKDKKLFIMANFEASNVSQIYKYSISKIL